MTKQPQLLIVDNPSPHLLPSFLLFFKMSPLYPYNKAGYTLYSNAFCPFAQRAIRALNLAKVPYQKIEIDLANKPDWYHLVNPQLKVPALRTPDGHLLIESLVISEYAADKYPESKLLSTDAVEKAQLRLFIEIFSSRITPNIYRLFRSKDVGEQEELRATLRRAVLELSKELETQWERPSGLGGPFWYGDKFGYAETVSASFLALLLKILSYWRQFEVPKTPEYEAFNRWADAVFKHQEYTEADPGLDVWTQKYSKYDN